MRIRLKKRKQNWLLEKAIEKAGSERKLKKILNIPNQTINRYRQEQSFISEERFNLIINFLNINGKEIENIIENKLDENWGSKKGGISLIKKHKENGTYNSYLNYLKKRGRVLFTQLHKDLKRKDPEAYYKDQYERFKKVGEYKYKTKRGEMVRNKLEKDTGDILFSLGANYEYEPYIFANNFAYFPDFKINNIIIECTAWRGYLKVNKLKKKLRDFEKEGFKVWFVIPEEIKKFYKPFEDKILTSLTKASVAQIIEQ